MFLKNLKKISLFFQSSIKTVTEDSGLRERDLNVRVANNRQEISGDTFLKKKEAQLRELREKEKKKAKVKEAKEQVKETVSSTGVVRGALSNIRRFYFPLGEPTNSDGNTRLLNDAKIEFGKLESGKAYKNNMATIMKVSRMFSFLQSVHYFYLLRQDLNNAFKHI